MISPVARSSSSLSWISSMAAYLASIESHFRRNREELASFNRRISLSKNDCEDPLNTSGPPVSESRSRGISGSMGSILKRRVGYSTERAMRVDCLDIARDSHVSIMCQSCVNHVIVVFEMAVLIYISYDTVLAVSICYPRWRSARCSYWIPSKRERQPFHRDIYANLHYQHDKVAKLDSLRSIRF